MTESVRTLSDTELLDALRMAGPTPSLDLVRAALERGPALAPALRDMLAQSPAKSLPQEDPRWYAELHAGMLLIGLRDAAALPIFAQKLRTTDENDAEVFLEWFNAPLAHYGGAAVPLLLELFTDRKVPVMTRWSLTEPLVLIAQRDPAERERIVAGLGSVLPQVSEQGEVVLSRPLTDDDIEIWSWALEALATLQAVAVVPVGVALYEAELVDELVMGDVNAFLAQIKARTPRLLPQPPEVIEYYREGVVPPFVAPVVPRQRPAPPQRPGAQQPFVRAEPKVGRNDPCPCGSGKKYKKCHGQGK